jgi:hypothetical protein
MNRPIRFAAAALSLAAVAACSDSPSAPVAPAEAPNAAILTAPGRTQYHVTYAVLGRDSTAMKSPEGYFIPTSVMFETNTGYQREVFDNKEGDLDARYGYYKVAMPAGASYKAGLRQVLPPYAAYGSIREKARTGTATDLGTVIANKMPMLRAMLRDQATYGYIGIGTIHVTGGNGYSNVVTDNLTGTDAAAQMGLINVYLPTSGSYKVCETDVPAGYFAPSPNCKTFTASWNEFSDVTFLHSKIFSGI